MARPGGFLKPITFPVTCLGLMYPLLAVSLVICIFQWWRDLPPSESDGAELEKTS